MQSPEKRFKQHCKSAKKQSIKHRPLYAAMRKYGIENFELLVVEECPDTIVDEREIFWIEFYQSFKNGYNATKGGEGKKYLDYDLICAIYEQIKNCTEVAKILQISPDSVSTILKNRNIIIKPSSEISKEKNSKIIHMFTLQDQYLQTFSSLSDAARFILESQNKNCNLDGIKVHIREVANKKRKTAYGYKWKWAVD